MQRQKNSPRKRPRKTWVLILLLLLFFCYFSWADSFGAVENRLQDRIYQARSPVDTRIVIVGIDEESLKGLGRWPWPRDYHARLIRSISQGRPAVLGIDLILSESAGNEAEDADLVSAVKTAGNVVVPVYGVLDEKSRDGKISVNELQRAFPALEAVSIEGHINTIPDSDGIAVRIIRYTHNPDQSLITVSFDFVISSYIIACIPIFCMISYTEHMFFRVIWFNYWINGRKMGELAQWAIICVILTYRC